MMMIKLRTNDDKLMEVSAKDLEMSGLIREMLPCHDEIPLFNVSGSTMTRVLEFARYYRKEPMKTIQKPLQEDGGLGVQFWYIRFIQRLQPDEWVRVLHAATYLDMQPLEELLCAWVASTLKGKECDTLKSIFGFDYLC